MTGNRRQFLAATVVLPFAQALVGAVGEDKGKRLGVVQYSYAIRLSADRATGKVGLSDPLTFIKHCHELSAGGVQTGIGIRDKDYLAKLRKRLELYAMYLEGTIRLPKDRADLERFTTEVRSARDAGAKVLRTVLIGSRRYEQFAAADDFHRAAERGWQSLRLAEPVVAKQDMLLAIENHKDYRTGELLDLLKSQGLQANQDVTFLTDGGEEIRSLAERVTPESEHVLDWFHITMRLTVLCRYARGVAHHDEAAGQSLLAGLERIKWLLWHGNQHRAGETISFFLDDVDGLEVNYPNLSKFARAAQEFSVYIASNTSSLINYGERFRAGERISSCLAESTVNAVISKRFAKRQQMQWTKRGAHLLLQTRTRALDGTLRPLFEKWYPGLANDNSAEIAQAEAA